MPPFRRSTIVWMLFGCLLAANPAGWAQEERKIFTAVYNLPPEIFGRPDGADPTGPLAPDKNVKFLSGEDGPTLSSHAYDVHEYLVAMGVNFPKGAEAIYFADQNALFIRNTKENLELFESAFRVGNKYQPPLVASTEFFLVSLRLPEEWLEKDHPDYASLRQAAGDSWKVIDTLRVVTKSGILAQGSSIPGGKAFIPPFPRRSYSPLPPDAIPSGSSGSICRVEPIIGPDGILIDAVVSFAHRSAAQRDQTPFELRYDGEAILRHGYPQILQLSAIGEGKNGGGIPARALIVRSSVVTTSPEPFGKEKP